jgi:hypothetical protein
MASRSGGMTSKRRSAARPANPILDTISLYGDARIPHERLEELAAECRRLANDCPRDAGTALRKIADLSERAARQPDYELRFDGD